MRKMIAFSLIILFNYSCSETKKNDLGSKEDTNGKISDNSDSSSEEIGNQTLPIKQIITLAQKHFAEYKKKLVTKNTFIGISEAYTGDFTNDGKEDVVIYYSIEPTDGGNYIAGQGLVLYKNNGKDVLFITSYSPDYYFSFDKVSGGNIFITKDEYSEDDPRCCPSLHKQIELTVNDDKIYERNIK